MRRTRISRAHRWARGLIAVVVAVSLGGWTITPATSWPGGLVIGCPIDDGWQTLGLTPWVPGLYLCREGPYGQAYLANNTQQVWGVTTTLADPTYRYNYVSSTSTTKTRLFRAVTSTKVKYALPGEVLLLPESFMQNSFTVNQALSTRWMYFDVLSTALPVGAAALAKKSPAFNALKACYAAGWSTGGALGALQDGSGTDVAIGAGLGAAAAAGKCKSAVNKAQGKTDSAAVQKFKSWVSDAQEVRSWAGEADDLERALQQAIRAHLIH